MGRLKGFVARIRSILRRAATERDLDDEIRHHIELETAENIRRGLPPTEARRRALITFGGVQAAKEEHRDGRGVRWLEDLMSDTRVALRALRRSPALTGAALVTLALGIGANTAVFSVVNAVILRPLPFQNADRLVMLSEDNPEKGWRRSLAAPANYLDWRERIRSFEDVAAYSEWGQETLIDERGPRLLRVASVTGNFFSVLGISPARGRLFTTAETWQTGVEGAVLSHRAWQREFGGADVHGRSIELEGRRVQVIGVAPADFVFPSDEIDLWMATGWKPADRGETWFRRAHWLRVVARLRPGLTHEAADAELQEVARQLQVEYPETNRVMGADMMPLQDFLVRDVQLPLLVLQGAVTLLLLLGCANVGNLMLVQATGREREAALRLALGAGRLRLARQAMMESVVLAVLGAAGGLAVAFLGTRILLALAPNGLLPDAPVRMDWQILAYALGLGVMSGVGFGTAPLLWNRRREPVELIKDGGSKGTESRRGRRFGTVLALGEVALALLLAIGAGLLVRSFDRLTTVDPGFDSSGTLTVAINLPQARYDSNEKIAGFFERLIARARTLPGVDEAATAVRPPLTGTAWTGDFHIEGRPAQDYGSEAVHETVSPDYFRVLRIPIKAGRAFADNDRSGTIPVVIINEALARRYFGPENPLGKRIAFDKVPDSTSVWRTVVGVVGSVRQSSLSLEPQIQLFVPVGQEPNNYSTLFLRTRRDPIDLVSAATRTIADLDPTLAVSTIATMDELKSRSLARQRFFMMLLLTFAGTGLLLAIVGVYGVMAHLAGRQVREMGIRLALGADRSRVQWIVIRQSLGFLVGGSVVGSVIALALTRAMRDLLFEVRPADPITFGVVFGILALATLGAAWLPARRAGRADPASVLRTD